MVLQEMTSRADMAEQELQLVVESSREADAVCAERGEILDPIPRHFHGSMLLLKLCHNAACASS